MRVFFFFFLLEQRPRLAKWSFSSLLLSFQFVDPPTKKSRSSKFPPIIFPPASRFSDLIAIPVFFSFILFTLVSPRHVCITCVCRRTVCFRFSKAWTSSGLITLDRTDLWTRSASNNRNSIADNRAKSTIYYETMRREVSII